MKGKTITLTGLYACLFSACVTAGRRITFGGDVILKNTETYIDPMTAADVLLFAVLAAVVWGAMLLIVRHKDRVLRLCRSRGERAHPVRFACLCALAILLVWLPYLLTVAPGNIYVDSIGSISQMLEHGHPTSNHHPMFYTLMIGVFLKIGTVVFGSLNIGVLLYSMFQTAVMLFCIVSVLTLLYIRRVAAWIIGAFTAYFMFVPFFPSYAMTMWKDPLFSCMLLLMSVLLYVLITEEKVHKLWTVCYAAVMMGAMIFRNNGLYVVIGTAILSALLIRRHAKRILAASASAVAIFVLATGLATHVWNIYGDFVENLGIPLLQMGYTINHDGEFSEEDEAYLFRLMPEEVWNYAYRPCLVDPLKWNPQFDMTFLEETKGEFFRTWASGLVKNPQEYVDAYLLATHGFWKPGVQNLYGYMDVQMYGEEYGLHFMDLFEKIFGFSIMPILKDYPIIIGSGTLLWLVLLGLAFALIRRTQGIAPYLPALLNFATVMVATPVAYSLRYVFIFALALPLYMTMPLMQAEGKDDQNGAIKSA